MLMGISGTVPIPQWILWCSGFPSGSSSKIRSCHVSESGLFKLGSCHVSQVVYVVHHCRKLVPARYWSCLLDFSACFHHGVGSEGVSAVFARVAHGNPVRSWFSLNLIRWSYSNFRPMEENHLSSNVTSNVHISFQVFGVWCLSSVYLFCFSSLVL